ncbi:MAG: hypothetical protein MJB14_00880, partial [Spirochaetes bacterium]|nr:hypothetical protein [Spirochaetota bacterium]
MFKKNFKMTVLFLLVIFPATLFISCGVNPSSSGGGGGGNGPGDDEDAAEQLLADLAPSLSSLMDEVA